MANYSSLDFVVEIWTSTEGYPGNVPLSCIREPLRFALVSLLKKMAIDHPYHTVFQLLTLENGDRIKGVVTLLWWVWIRKLETKKEDTNKKVPVVVVTSTFPIDHSCQYHEGSFAHFKGLVDSVTYVSKMLMSSVATSTISLFTSLLLTLTHITKHWAMNDDDEDNSGSFKIVRFLSSNFVRKVTTKDLCGTF
ncbi:hypothetical protein POM88_049612 [Heracleum sosnowskyi]|uniref:Uncharacterized protein n=1 Tax=Heracleum sosnowskyi TaxID=360622 RepID=A0AAD8M0Q2_9APIA|nr:hypothetical protein POM88_049612 [Heracleum sosnowskyi]